MPDNATKGKEAPKVPQPDDIYKEQSEKVKDFVIGFFAAIGITVAYNMVCALIVWLITMVVVAQKTIAFDPSLSFLVIYGAEAVVYIIGLVFAIYKLKQTKRRFIMVGAITAVAAMVLIPLLIFGACVAILSSGW
ncbi:MAG: hypothetical protein HGA85_03515 [Nanoarchaeota archaeon]|nr:hypothetical protein [Nanoarchaeota archaeon]